MKSIGIIGTGIMGSGMAMNFLKHGYKVFVWNRTAKSTPGATICETPKEVTERADLIFEVTANDESSQVVWSGDGGILAAATPEKILVTCATLSIRWIEELAKQCAELNCKFLEMGMTGSRTGAESGQLIFLAGGSQQTLDSIREDLKAISSQVLYFGKAGSGMKYKLILNALQAVHIIVFGEALKMAEATGLDPNIVGEALAERPGGTTTKLAWRDFRQDPQPINFALKWITKDLDYALQMLDGNNDAKMIREALREYKRALQKGLGDKDWTVINKS